MILLNIIIVLAAISLLVLIHELGHFIMAKRFGIWVEEFGLGLPPRLWGKKIGETVYSINLLPMGGFVKLHGEDEGAVHYSKVKKPKRMFYKKPWWQRSIILFAGIFMNFVFAVAVISYLYTKGVAVPDKVVVNMVAANSPAEQAGIIKDDTIVAIEGIKVTQISDVTDIISKRLDTETSLEIQRNQNNQPQTLNVKLVPRKNPPQGEGAMGVQLSQKVIIKNYPFYQAPFYGLKASIDLSWTLLRSIVTVFWQFITGFKVPQDVAGPIGIYQLYGEARQYGLSAILELSGLVSLNLAVVNLFPIPPLDGSRLLFAIIEGTTGKKLKKEWELNMYKISFILLILLFILISIQDIRRLLHI